MNAGSKHREKDRALVRSIVTLSKDLGIRTVAEYVKDRAVLDQVIVQGIDLAQGFYIHRPSISIPEAMRVKQAWIAWRRVRRRVASADF